MLTKWNTILDPAQNVSPIGRNCSQEERDDFEKYDHQAGVRWVDAA